METSLNYIKGLLSNFLNAIKTWFQDIIIYILEFILEGALQILGWINSIVLWLFDKAAYLCTGSGFTGAGYGNGATNAWSDVPATVIHFLHMVNILSIVQILLCAIFIRIILNLIPTWATRV